MLAPHRMKKQEKVESPWRYIFIDRKLHVLLCYFVRAPPHKRVEQRFFYMFLIRYI